MPNSIADANLQVGPGVIPPVDVSACLGENPGFQDTRCGGSSVSGPFAINLPQSGTVSMSAELEVSNGTGTAFVDPTFTLPAGYSVAFSPGVGNEETTGTPPGTGTGPTSPTSVPEPASLTLLAASLAGLGLLRRSTV